MSKCEDLTKAVELRLAILALTETEPDVELINSISIEQEQVSARLLKSESKTEIFEDIKNQKMEAIKRIAYGIGTNEEIERELRSKYTEIQRMAVKNAIIDEITEPIWIQQDENNQEEIIAEVEQYDNIEEGIRKSIRIAALSKLANESDKMDDSEKEKGKKDRRLLLEKLDQNYDKELQSMLADVDNQKKVKNAEKMRQLRLAKLRREKKMIAKENANDIFRIGS